MMVRLTLCWLITLSLCTCDSAQKNDGDSSEIVEVPAGAEATVTENSFPSIPFERLKYIFENATYMDATFYDMPISINQKELAQIQATIGGIGSQPMKSGPSCKPIGHIWFQIDGKNIEEADIYFQDPCVGYVWYDQGKPAFSNAMTEGGAAFYLNIFQSVEQNTGQ